ncbi:endonuclease/exonuclease/phosphatase family protein [Rhizohabitans arisaemae]|uniref:endonuclease/exonuclease/phosphatase family protein n=1 Tax=Rhizohabitans arisaemae TaxID=2720610 RepID=UPI0024B0E77C|nr:endonuclease/exonuclease/phosphatase family protein [Rhizohabitans arisaemae]
MSVLVGLVLKIPREADAAAVYTIGQFNMAGAHHVHGWKGSPVPASFVDSVLSRRPAFVMVQETCGNWVSYLKSALRDYHVVFDPVSNGRGRSARCRHGSPLGNAVIARRDLGFEEYPVSYALGTPVGREQREMLCLKSWGRKLVACSAHLTTGAASWQRQARLTEAQRVKQLLSAYIASGHKVFFGGDLNDIPISSTTDNLYDAGYGQNAHGTMREVTSPCVNTIRAGCRTGTVTHSWLNRKIDYLLVGKSVTVTQAADVRPSMQSDHKYLWGFVKIP